MPDKTRPAITDYLGRPLTRRQAIKAGGITAVGLVFSKPIIDTIRPIPAFASYPGGGDPPTPVCPEFFNGFETDTNGWFPFGGGTITRVPSETNGITSSNGSFHAEATGGPSGPYTQWGGYNSVFAAGGYSTFLDIYLDVNGGFANDTRFDWSSAINMPDGNHRRDFVFNGGFYNDATGPGGGTNRFIFSASTNALRANSFPKNPGRDPIAISSTGWYTFMHRFYDSGGGVLAVDLSIIDQGGTVLNTWTLSDPTDIIGTTVGGNRYGLLASIEFPFLAIDNSSKVCN